MSTLSSLSQLVRGVQQNCDLSDARDHGIYSMCTMVLKLRNLYKWEQALEPWQEPEASDLLDWIDAKENFWQSIEGGTYHPLESAGGQVEPFELETINADLAGTGFYYGAGYGRSMKTVFFLADVLERRRDDGCPIVILGRERAREMDSPFAMVQDGHIVIRRESLRFFIWDQVQEVRSSSRCSLLTALRCHGLLTDGALDQRRFRDRLDAVVDGEMDLFIRHEIGEMQQGVFSSETLRMLVGRFPGTVIEFVCRAVKDILADCHPLGPLAHIVGQRRESTLGFYLTFLDGLRQKLFAEMVPAWQRFQEDRQWAHIEAARSDCWERYRRLAATIAGVAELIDREPDERIVALFGERVLAPLGMDRS